MILQSQFLNPQIHPSIIQTHKPKSHKVPSLRQIKQNPQVKTPLKCSISVISDQKTSTKPQACEVSRTIMELSTNGTLCTLTHDGWPLGIGVRFTVDHLGTPLLCFNNAHHHHHPLFSPHKRSTLHVQLEQCGLRTPQCTIQGSLDRPEDKMLLKKLHSVWKKRFGEEINEDLLYVVSVDRVLQLEDYQEDGVWVTSSDYKGACPDPLREIAEMIVTEINANSMEDVLRFCNIYADLPFQVSKAKMVWVDRLGFDIRLYSPPNGIYEVRIPFPREVTDKKDFKATFNGMSQVAWEVEKNYYPSDFKRVTHAKKLALAGV